MLLGLNIAHFKALPVVPTRNNNVFFVKYIYIYVFIIIIILLF